MPTGHWRGALRSLAEVGDPGARKPPQPETSKRPTTIAPRWVGACGDSCPTSNSKPVVRKGCYRATRASPSCRLCITWSTRALLAGRRLDGARRQDGASHARRLRLVASAGCARGPARAVRRGARHLGRLGRGTKARGGHGQAVGCRAAAATAAALGRSWLVATASAARSGVVRPVSWLSPTFAAGQGGNGTVEGG